MGHTDQSRRTRRRRPATSQRESLVGRAEELEAVRQAIDDGSGVIVAGPAGVGKSRLLQEVLADFADDPRVVQVTGGQTSMSVPFGAFAAWWPEDGDVPSPPRLLVHLAAAIRAESDRVLLVVEDAHAIDEDSAALIEHLVGSGVATVVAAVRSGEPVPAPITALWASGKVRRLDLQRLSRRESSTLVEQILGGPVARGALEAIWQVAGGLPLWVQEVVLDAAAGGHLSNTGGMWLWDGQLEAAARLIELTGLRVSRLSDDARHALRLVAFGEPIPLEVLDGAISPTVLEQLDEQRLLVVDDDQVRTAHPLYREVIRADTPSLTRRRTMGELARLFVAAGALTRSERMRVAELAVEGGYDLDHTLFVEAAQDACNLGRLDMAERLARAATTHHEARGGIVLAAILSEQGRSADAAAALATVRLSSLSNAEVAQWLRWRLSLLVYAGFDVDAARAVVDETLIVVSDPDWRAHLEAQLATSCALSGHVAEGHAIAAPLIEHPTPSVRVRALSGWGPGEIFLGRPLGAATRAEGMLGDALAMHDSFPDAPHWAMSTAIAGRMSAGDLKTSIGLLDIVEAQQPTIGLRNASLLLFRGLAEMLRGNPHSALALLREATAGISDSLDQHYGRCARSWGAAAAALCGDQAAAEATWAEVESRWSSIVSYYDFQALRAELWVAFGRGDLAGAFDAAKRIADDFAERGWPHLELTVLHDAFRLGAPDITERLDIVASQVDGPWAQACALQIRGVMHDAPDLLLQAGEQFAAVHMHVQAAEAANQAAIAFETAGLTAKASRAAARSAAMLRACEGYRTPLLASRQPEPLTRREQQIATLAAQGEPNKGIATQLGIGVRTVESHLARIYVKLGVNSRADLADLL